MRAVRRLAVVTVSLGLLLAVPAAAQAAWGAIAIDPTTGKVGYSHQQPSAVASKKKALHECGESHCKVAVWVFNGYGAVVKKKNGLYIAGIDRTKNLAFRDARERAHESAPAVAWIFSGLD
jgi:hypothetical protein